jgi:hypothetical protein
MRMFDQSRMDDSILAELEVKGGMKRSVTKASDLIEVKPKELPDTELSGYNARLAEFERVR